MRVNSAHAPVRSEVHHHAGKQSDQAKIAAPAPSGHPEARLRQERHQQRDRRKENQRRTDEPNHASQPRG
jgi:hypothetical protein